MSAAWTAGGGDAPQQQQQQAEVGLQPIRDDLLVREQPLPWLEIGAGIIVPLVLDWLLYRAATIVYALAI